MNSSGIGYGVARFRIDTVKHVNTEFWQKFASQGEPTRYLRDFFREDDYYSLTQKATWTSR